MMTKRYIFSVIGAFLLALIITGCGDNGTGVNPGEPPSLPDLTAAQPDFSYFDQNMQKVRSKLQFGDAYGSASMTVMSAGFLFGMGQLGTMYFGMAESEQAVYKDGQWLW